MTYRAAFVAVASTCLGLFMAMASAPATAQVAPPNCPVGPAAISFITFQSFNNQTASGPWTIEGKLSMPTVPVSGPRSPCVSAKMPAVVILHGSAGVDSRGDFYESSLNAAGIATLQIDMWQARGVTSVATRPPAPVYTYPDAFAALAYLAALPSIDAAHIGVLGFSWGGVVSLAAAEKLYSGTYGQGRQFAAHVANYPVCYGANNLTIPQLQPPAVLGTQFLNLTGAPVLIQIGSKDSYDNGTQHCIDLANSVNATNGNVVSVNTYPGAYHAFDRIMVPETELDPFANEGSYFRTGILPTVTIIPDVAQARQSRDRVTAFFKQHLF